MKWQGGDIKKTSLLAKHYMFTNTQPNASGSLFYEKKLYLKIASTPGFQFHKIQKNSCCCGILGYSCLKPQLRLGCLHSSTRTGTRRCKASGSGLVSLCRIWPRTVVLPCCWAAELHHSRALTHPPQKKRGRRKYAGKKKKKLTG